MSTALGGTSLGGTLLVIVYYLVYKHGLHSSCRAGGATITVEVTTATGTDHPQSANDKSTETVTSSQCLVIPTGAPPLDPEWEQGPRAREQRSNSQGLALTPVNPLRPPRAPRGIPHASSKDSETLEHVVVIPEVAHAPV